MKNGYQTYNKLLLIYLYDHIKNLIVRVILSVQKFEFSRVILARFFNKFRKIIEKRTFFLSKTTHVRPFLFPP